MSLEKPTKKWRPADIDALLDLARVMESPNFEIMTWPDLPDLEENGTRIVQMPYPEYNPVVGLIMDMLYDSSAYIDPYGTLPEDPEVDGRPFQPMGAEFPPDYFHRATLNQVRRYLVLCTRGEKFCDGHIGAEFKKGSFPAAFARLRALRSEMN